MNKLFNNKNLLLALLILINAAALRFFHYTGFSLSNDELSALVRLHYDTFGELVEKGFYVDGHPGGIQVLLFYWVKLFGDSDASIRFPFVVMGVLAVWFTWLTAKRWFGETSALFIAAGLAFLQFPILYSQVARPYGSGLFFAILTAYFWTRLIFNFNPKGNRKYWDSAGYALGNVLMMYNHYFSFLLAVVIGITGLFLLRKENWKFFTLAGLISAILFIPHIHITLNHLSIGGVGLWLGKPGIAWLFEHLLYVFNDSKWVLATVAAISLIGFLGQKADRQSRTLRIIALIWFVVPIAVGFLYSLYINPVLQHSVVIFSFPFLLFFMFSFIQWKTDTFRSILLGVMGMVLLGSVLIEKKYYQSQHFGEFKDVAARIAEWDETYGSVNISHAISVNNPYYIGYYLKKLNAKPQFVHYNNRTNGEDLFSLKQALEAAQTPYFLYAWTKAVPYETQDLIRHYYPYIVKHIEYDGLSAITLYSREADQESIARQQVFEMSNNFESGLLWNMRESNIDTMDFSSPRNSILLQPEDEYGPTFQAAAGDIQVQQGSTVRVKMMVRTCIENSKAALVFSLEQWEQTPYVWAASPVSNYVVNGVWSPVFLTCPVKELKSTRDILKVYLWNQAHEQIWIDDIKINID